mgnify:CR=1 FL=1
MKKQVIKLIGLTLSVIVLVGCSQNQTSIEEMLKDPEQQMKAINTIVSDHQLAELCIENLMDDQHAKNMMLDGVVSEASVDAEVGARLNDKIAEYPELMMFTINHFIPIVELDSSMCSGFCDHTMESEPIMDKMCHKMNEDTKMSCCH